MVTVRNDPALILTVRMEENNVHTVLVQIIIVKVVSSVHILRVPVLTAVKVVNSVLTLRVLVPAVIIKAAIVLIVLVPVVIKVVDTIVPIAPVRLIITRMQSIV